MKEIDEQKEFEELRKRDDVEPEELLKRVQNAPDMGGEILVALGNFIEKSTNILRPTK